jgi:hypothetical protein
MELTRTNRSGGLTTYFSQVSRAQQCVAGDRADEREARGAGLQPEPLWLEVRRETVKAITLIATIPDACRVSGRKRCTRSGAHPSAVCTCWTPRQPGFALRRFFFLVATPERSHPFPSRTRKLSSPGPMVLQGQPCGRVGRCRGFEGSVERLGPLLFFGSRSVLLHPLADRIVARRVVEAGLEHRHLQARRAIAERARLLQVVDRLGAVGAGARAA